MPATRQDLIFEIGADSPFPNQFIWQTDDETSVDLTGATIKMEVRPSVGGAVILTLSTANGKITITNSTEINLSIDAVDVTTALNASLTRFGTVTAGVIEGTLEDTIISATGYLASYDLKITQTDGTVSRLIFGDVCFSQEITQ
jgi:hypothetical protein